MAAECILAIDQGTTNTKALLVGRDGSPVFCTSSSVRLIYTPEGHVEQDPMALWNSVRMVIADALALAKSRSIDIRAVAISNQRETAVAWNAETGEPVAPAVSWQCGRAAEICSRLAPHAAELRSKTGLPLAPLISAGKWAWLIENMPCVRTLAATGTLRLGTIDSWLIHQFTKGAIHATDHTNASRTGLLNLGTMRWDGQLAEIFAVPVQALPSVRNSAGSFGSCTGIPGLDGVPILSAIGDSHAAMFGQARYSQGVVKATYGTGSSLMAITPSLTADTPALARTIGWSIKDDIQFALEGNIAMTGSAVQWVGQFLGLDDPVTGAAALAKKVTNSAGIFFVPAMGGLGAPHWDAEACGLICGIGRNHTSAHLARAAIDAIAYQIADVFFAIEEAAGIEFKELCADGGATRNTELMQFQADVLGRPVLRSSTEELSALGAAWLAGLALGWWSLPAQIEALPHASDRFTPAMASPERNRLYAGWNAAVSRARLKEAAAK